MQRCQPWRPMLRPLFGLPLLAPFSPWNRKPHFILWSVASYFTTIPWLKHRHMLRTRSLGSSRASTSGLAGLAATLMSAPPLPKMIAIHFYILPPTIANLTALRDDALFVAFWPGLFMTCLRNSGGFVQLLDGSKLCRIV